MCRIEFPDTLFNTMQEITGVLYWTLFAIAGIGALGSIISVLSGRWGWLAVSCGLVVPYGFMWVIDYGSNCLIRKEIPVTAVLVSTNIDESVDGRNVRVRLIPQQRTFYDEPTLFEFINYGSVDNRSVSVVRAMTNRGVDGLIGSVDLELFVPNMGSTGARLSRVGFGRNQYSVKSQILEFQEQYATD
jgi:hypothetical protein